jgi:hypothetical protein
MDVRKTECRDPDRYRKGFAERWSSPQKTICGHVPLPSIGRYINAIILIVTGCCYSQVGLNRLSSENQMKLTKLAGYNLRSWRERWNLACLLALWLLERVVSLNIANVGLNHSQQLSKLIPDWFLFLEQFVSAYNAFAANLPGWAPAIQPVQYCRLLRPSAWRH